MDRPSFKNLILQESPHWLAIHKPAGLIVERSPFESPTIEDLTLEYLSESRRNPYLGIVHRLDRVTSGVLLLAKKKSSLKNLNEQFARRQVKKIYLALVEKSPPSENGTLRNWLEKDQQNKRAIIHQEARKGAVEVQLKYRLIQKKDLFFLLEIHPQTGKFHQIRAQLAALGCPIVGDEKYGATSTYQPKAIGLHAWKLEFRDPVTGERTSVEAEWGF